jgi:hypothetical protein
MVMAVLIYNFSYPTEQTEAVTKRLQEVGPKFQAPDYVTVRGPYWNGDIEKGVKGFAIFELDASKIFEERTRLAAFANAFHGIPGLKWNIELWADQADIQARREKWGF